MNRKWVDYAKWWSLLVRVCYQQGYSVLLLQRFTFFVEYISGDKIQFQCSRVNTCVNQGIVLVNRELQSLVVHSISIRWTATKWKVLCSFELCKKNFHTKTESYNRSKWRDITTKVKGYLWEPVNMWIILFQFSCFSGSRSENF